MKNDHTAVPQFPLLTSKNGGAGGRLAGGSPGREAACPRLPSLLVRCLLLPTLRRGDAIRTPKLKWNSLYFIFFF